MRLAFTWGWYKYGTLAFWRSKEDSMQYAIAELSKEHEVRMFVARKGLPRQVINDQDVTFYQTSAALVNHLKQFKPHMIFMNTISDPKWGSVIKAFPKTWKSIMDYGDPKPKLPFPQMVNNVIVQQEHQRMLVANMNNIPLSKVLVNPFCVDTSVFKPLPVEKTHTGIMVADFRSNIKRQGLLIRAWKNIPGSLVLIGPFWRSRPHKYHVRCMELAKKLGIRNRVHVLDGRPNHELPALINKAKIAYYTSVREGGPRALLEMMSCGLPAIVMKGCLGTTSLIKHGVDGWIADPTPRGIRAATNVVLKNWRKMGQAASKRIRSQYPYDRMLNFYRGLIRRIG